MIRKGLLLSALPLAAIAGMGAWGYLAAEPGARFPVHWGFDGRPDRFGGRSEAFLGLPLLAFAVALSMAFLPRLDPRGTNLQRSDTAFLTVWIGLLSLLALIQTGLTLIALGVWSGGEESPFNRLLAAGVALLLALTGNVLGKARPNWFLGVRTPWTLTSDLSWERTHRLAGRLFVLTGLAGLVAALALPVSTAMPLILVGVLAASVVSVIYSYLVWRRAPDKATGPQAVEP